MSTELGVALPRLAAGEVPSSRLQWHVDLPPYMRADNFVAFPGRVALLAESGGLDNVYVLPANRHDAQTVANSVAIDETIGSAVLKHLRQNRGDLSPQMILPERDITQNIYRRDVVLGVDMAGLQAQLGSEMRNAAAWQRVLNSHLRREITIAAIDNTVGLPALFGGATMVGAEILQHLPGTSFSYFDAHPLMLPPITAAAAAIIHDVHMFCTTRDQGRRRDLPYVFMPFGLDRLACIGIAAMRSRTIIGLAGEAEK